jgi:uncharacterized protein YneF (UPF0154 family)
MRWLVLCLLVSLAALLFAAAGMALHILMQRRQLRRKPPDSIDPAEETDLKPEV